VFLTLHFYDNRSKFTNKHNIEQFITVRSSDLAVFFCPDVPHTTAMKYIPNCPKFPQRQLLLPDGALILPVITDRIILVKDNKTSNNRLKLGRTSKQRSNEMSGGANIVEKYAGADVPARIELLIKYYPNFIRLVEGYEQSLSFIIKEERAYARRSQQGDLGVRVQTSGTSDPTAKAAIENIMILEAIQKGNLEEITSGLDDQVSQKYEREVTTIQNMREDYQVLQNNLYYLSTEDADVFIQYLNCGGQAEKMSYDMDVKSNALRTRICRSKKIVVDQTSSILIRKYQHR